MLRRAIAAMLLAFGSAQPTMAQPLAAPPNPRFETVEYRADEAVRLVGRPGYATTIVLASDEQIESIALGDSSAWQATPSKSGSYLFVKPLGIADTNMTVVTNARTYVFELSVAEDAPYIVRFNYPRPVGDISGEQAPALSAARYRLSGAHALRPVSIRDDGAHVFIEWPPQASLPAIYAVDDGGQETLLNGAMRDGRYVIDSINHRLVFRRDRLATFAERSLPKMRRERR